MMVNILDQAVDVLNNAGWTVIPNHKAGELQIPAYRKSIPSLLKQFMLRFDLCLSPNEKTWFVLNSYFTRDGDSAFAWNEWEQMSLESTNDGQEIARIKKFWSNHIPIVLSVQSPYAYFACCLKEERFGKIVYGSEPEFEEYEEVADSFEQFLQQLIGFYTGEDHNSPLKYVLS